MLNFIAFFCKILGKYYKNLKNRAFTILLGAGLRF